MGREPRPDFERYRTALRCQEPDRVLLGEWRVDQWPKEAYLARPIETLQEQEGF